MAPEYYNFTGRDGELIPRHITHVIIDKGLKFVPADAFYKHPNIQEVICHDGVERIEKHAFSCCHRLLRVIMLGVKVVEESAFHLCKFLTYIECSKLERIGELALGNCTSLSSIDLPSINIVEGRAFRDCKNLTNAKFGKELESIGRGAFLNCPSLERISLPLKDGVMTADDIFQRCVKLHHVDLVGGVHETADALLLEEWKDDMNEEIYEIDQVLPNTPAGISSSVAYDAGGKARTIRSWITSVLRKIIHYKAEHRRILNEAATTLLQTTLPNDILLKNVLPFLELPSYRFEGEN